MTNVFRRLHKVERRLTDRSSFVPHSQRWLEYWGQRLDGILTGTDRGRIPLEAFRAVIACGNPAGPEEETW
jgi:hypothetical protein